ncbi:MAG TPA: DMT family transporter [Usitatibacter sp.]|jgi:drug/metabolite transporter (DMT)-like permease|nr:DMT family transporter [Usitatibacter sp.]
MSIATAWIPVTVFAAFAQTVRNAAQRHLTTDLGTLGATLVRFFYGVPFAALWLWGVASFTRPAAPAPNASFALWVLLGAVAQVLATALLLRVMQERNFALGIAYSKSEVLQVAVFGMLFLGDRGSIGSTLAVLSGTAGVFLLSGGWRADFAARTAVMGVACGGLLALAMVSFRGAELALGEGSFVMTAAYTLLVAQVIQSVLLGGWLLVRDAQVVVRVLKAWRVSLFAGLMGAAASAGWFTAFAMEPVAHVRTLGLIELVFSYIVSRRLFRERLRGVELAGMALLALGVAIITAAP